ncbi:unnamed protein product [Cunninghamella blakesleeana]
MQVCAFSGIQKLLCDFIHQLKNSVLGKVLLPSIVTKFSIEDEEAKSLLRHMEINDHRYILCVPVKRNSGNDNNLLTNLNHIGCVATVVNVDTSIKGHVVLLVHGICRSTIQDIYSNNPLDALYHGQVTHHFMESINDMKMWYNQFCQLGEEFVVKMGSIGVSNTVLSPFQHLFSDNNEISTTDNDNDNSLPYTSVFDVAHFLLCMTDATMDEKLLVLGLTDSKFILQEIQSIVTRHLQVLNDSQKIQQSIEEKLDKKRREFYLRQQFHIIAPTMKNESSSLNDITSSMTATSTMIHLSGISKDSKNQSQQHHQQQQQDDICLFMPKQDDDDDTSTLKNQLNNAGLPSHVQSIIKRDLNRLSKIPSAAPESTLLRTYLEWIADLPWKNANQNSSLEINAAKYQLNADHFGLDYVKRRILEYLSVLKVKKDTASSPILCFVGPPGVGKTTLAISIAKALQRKFHRIALGGVRDEAEIRGHRRTYVGALPGLLISGLRKAGVNNPLFLLDEIDKIVQGTHQGDPAAALLEVLDPAQNGSFTDHFLNVPFDLSNILFIATANSLDTIPGPLLDRMEIIQLHGYTMDEKLDIARSHLLPKQLFAHGFSSKENDSVPTLNLSNEVLAHLIENYTMESGVRNLDRVIASVCRYKCREYADSLENNAISFNPIVLTEDLDTILGIAPYGNEALDTHSTPGIATGLAYSQSGCGGVLPIEANIMPGQGQLKLTGSLGDVIKESAHIALSWIKANAYNLKITSHQKERLLSDMDLHLHIPNGAIKKDGPSAGVAMTVCMVSLFSGKVVPRKTAMTGEITLSGKVMPVGGIKEKVISAHRAGVTKVILPIANKKDLLQDVPDKVKNDLTIIYCQHISEVLEAAFDEKFDHESLAGYPIQYASRL